MIIAIRDVTFTEHLIIQNGIFLLFKGKYTKYEGWSQMWSRPKQRNGFIPVPGSRGEGTE